MNASRFHCDALVNNDRKLSDQTSSFPFPYCLVGFKDSSRSFLLIVEENFAPVVPVNLEILPTKLVVRICGFYSFVILPSPLITTKQSPGCFDERVKVKNEGTFF